MNKLPRRQKSQNLPSLKNTTPAFKILSGSHKGKQFRLLSSKITIGKDRECDVILRDNSKCSKYHARVKQENGSYIIKSLDLKNPVLINNKPISAQVLKQKDKVTIGDVQFLFIEAAPVNLPSSGIKSKPKKKTRGKQRWLTPPRLILIILLMIGVFLLTSEDKKEEKAALDLRTEADVLEEVEKLAKENEQAKKAQTLSPQVKAARVAFIKGFRDYRKGYFYRALKMFRHCLTLHKTNTLCQSYSRKSTVQIERLIQRKIRLGKSYQANKQYEACRAVFKSVEIMIQDSRNPVYKEARQNKRLCEIQLENKI